MRLFFLRFRDKLERTVFKLFFPSLEKCQNGYVERRYVSGFERNPHGVHAYTEGRYCVSSWIDTSRIILLYRNTAINVKIECSIRCYPADLVFPASV